MLKKIAAALMLCAVSLATSSALQSGPALSVHFEYSPEDYAHVRTLQERLERALKKSGLGQLDEPELHADGNDGYFDIRGADPGRLYKIVEPILKSSPLMIGAEVTKRTSTGNTIFILRNGGSSK